MARGRFRFEVDHPAYFTFATGRFHVVRGKGTPRVAAYLLHPRETLDPYLAGVQRILSVLEGELRPYRFGEMRPVEIPRDLANQAGFNAAGIPGCTLLNSRAFDAPKVDYLLEWLGHELAHSWFPGLVAFRTPPGLYMEEALAEYHGARVVGILSATNADPPARRSATPWVR